MFLMSFQSVQFEGQRVVFQAVWDVTPEGSITAKIFCEMMKALFSNPQGQPPECFSKSGMLVGQIVPRRTEGQEVVDS